LCVFERPDQTVASLYRVSRILLIIAACCVTRAAFADDVAPQATSTVEAGKSRFSERCVFCHGGGGKGAKGPCLTCGRFRHGGSDGSLYANIAGGIPGTQMGAFGTTLSQEEILNIIAFLRAETKRRQEAGELEQ
jgi:mono/diheme cytochrome c family protein